VTHSEEVKGTPNELGVTREELVALILDCKERLRWPPIKIGSAVMDRIAETAGDRQYEIGVQEQANDLIREVIGRPPLEVPSRVFTRRMRPIERVEVEKKSGRLVIVPFSAESQRPTRWLWEPRVPLGALTIVCGEPETGKTTTVIDVMSRSSTARPMPDGSPGESGMWFYVSSENDPWRTIKPRIVAAGGDVHEIRRIKATELTGKTREERAFELERDVAALDAAIAGGSTDENTIGVVFDPLNEYLGEKVNSWRDGDVLRVLGPLVDLAEKYQVAVIGIMHPGKGEASTVLNKILGSKAFTMKARSVLFCAEDDEQEEEGGAGKTRTRYLMMNEKSSLAVKAPTLRYEFEAVPVKAARGDDPALLVGMKPVPIVKWHAGTVDKRMRDVAMAAKGGRSATVESCMGWLVERLRGRGLVDSKTIEAEAAAKGYGEGTLKNAKKRLGVASKQIGFHGGWQMSLDLVEPTKDEFGNYLP